MSADLALQAEGLAVGRQDQLDGRGVEADAVVQRLHVVPLVDAADRHHRHQHVDRLDVARVAGEQRLDVERLVGLDHEVHPGRRDIHSRQVARVVDDTVDLDDDDAVAERGGLHQRRGVFRARPGVHVAFAVGDETGDQRHVGDQVDHQPRVQLDVGVDRADLQQAVFEQLADAQTLRAGEGEVELARDAQFEQVEMLRAADAGHDHVQVVQLAGIDPRQRTGEEIRLLLVVAFQHHPIARRDQRLQRGDQAFAAAAPRRQPGRARARGAAAFPGGAATTAAGRDRCRHVGSRFHAVVRSHVRQAARPVQSSRATNRYAKVNDLEDQARRRAWLSIRYCKRNRCR